MRLVRHHVKTLGRLGILHFSDPEGNHAREHCEY